MDFLSHQRRAEEIRRELTAELTDKLQMNDEEKERTRQKWFGGDVIQKLEEPAKPKEFIVRCPHGHPVQKSDIDTQRAWLCQGSSKPFADRCLNGSHTGNARYQCTDIMCTYDGMCEDHYDQHLKELKLQERNQFMSSYMSNRQYASAGLGYRNVSPKRGRWPQ
eukprot:TRINITY_DN32637_c0_g1_i1.p1 TRINITY_DN32637_c0_g1~~TRINITY_DN32637_c0_g1_i1.p1  ORF type:complete len:181 (+),score=57.88 TRINITY_DN32637_c0_g1_i1:54-545(+)